MLNLVIWKKGDGSFYHKFVKGTYSKYYVGMKNQYGHEVYLVVPNLYYIDYKPRKRKVSIKRLLIRFLENI